MPKTTESTRQFNAYCLYHDFINKTLPLFSKKDHKLIISLRIYELENLAITKSMKHQRNYDVKMLIELLEKKV